MNARFKIGLAQGMSAFSLVSKRGRQRIHMALLVVALEVDCPLLHKVARHRAAFISRGKSCQEQL
jgi:hypothetical protein